MDQDFVNIVLTTKGTQITSEAYSNDVRINLRKTNCLIYTNTIYLIKRPDLPPGPLPPSGQYFFQVELANVLPITISGNGTSAKLLISFSTMVDTTQNIVQYTPMYPPATARRTLKISENEKWHMEISNEIPVAHPLLPYYYIDIECTIIVPSNPRLVPSAISTQDPLITRGAGLSHPFASLLPAATASARGIQKKPTSRKITRGPPAYRQRKLDLK